MATFPPEMQWLRFGSRAGASAPQPADGGRAARFAALAEGLAAAERRIESLEAGVRSSPAAVEARLAALVAGIAAAEQRLEALETVSQAQTARAERLDRLAASATAGAPIPSSACAGVVPSPEDQVQEAKVGAAALARGFSAATAAFHYVPAGYYDRTLEERKSMLGAPSVDYLCKTIVVENRKWQLAQALPPPADGDVDTMAARSRYFGVVFQYGARFKKENMEREVRKRGGLTKKQCQILFADEAEVVAMTGFIHNVSPHLEYHKAVS